jgi:hypothetical protein
LPFGRLWYGGPNAASNAVGYKKFYSWSQDAMIRAYDDAGNVIETHKGEFRAVCVSMEHRVARSEQAR